MRSGGGGSIFVLVHTPFSDSVNDCTAQAQGKVDCPDSPPRDHCSYVTLVQYRFRPPDRRALVAVGPVLSQNPFNKTLLTYSKLTR